MQSLIKKEQSRKSYLENNKAKFVRAGDAKAADGLQDFMKDSGQAWSKWFADDSREYLSLKVLFYSCNAKRIKIQVRQDMGNI